MDSEKTKKKTKKKKPSIYNLFSLFYYSGTYSYSRLGVEQVFCFLNLSHSSYINDHTLRQEPKKTYTFKNEDKSTRLDNIGFVFSLACYQKLNYSFHFRNMPPLNLSFQSIIFSFTDKDASSLCFLY